MNKHGRLKFHQWNLTHILPLSAVLFGHKIQAQFADNMSTSGMCSGTLKPKEAFNNKTSQALDQFIKYKCCWSSYNKAFSKLPSPPKSTLVFPYPFVYVLPHVVSPHCPDFPSSCVFYIFTFKLSKECCSCKSNSFTMSLKLTVTLIT
jgi:hypothetical protein